MRLHAFVLCFLRFSTRLPPGGRCPAWSATALSGGLEWRGVTEFVPGGAAVRLAVALRKT